MEYTNLGATGLSVSRVCLGCMSFGEPDSGGHPWSLPAEQARPFFQRALEHGITFFDTANAYSHGSSEQITGAALRELAPRESYVLATKIFMRMEPGPGGGGLSRKAVLAQVDASLARLGTDYVDLLQIHRFDPHTPMAETMQALHDVVRAGKARYLGASSMWTWQFAQLQHTAERHGWTPFVSMQDQYSLLMREEEREMLPYCAATGVGVIPWSPLARGRLARPWGTTTDRSQTDEFGRTLFSEADRPIVEAVQSVADSRGVPMAQVALAWVLAQPTVTAPIVGATKTEHLDDAVAAVDLQLTDDELATLAAPYTPRQPTGFR